MAWNKKHRPSPKGYKTVCWNDFCRANSLKYTRILVSYVIACEKAKIGPRWVRETEFLTQSHMLRNSPGVFRRVAVAARLFCLSLCSWHPSIARSAAYPNEKWVWNYDLIEASSVSGWNGNTIIGHKHTNKIAMKKGSGQWMDAITKINIEDAQNTICGKNNAITLPGHANDERQ